MAHHGKFAVKRMAKSTLESYGKLSHAKDHGKKWSPASQKRMANNGIFTFPSVKASHGLPFANKEKKNGKSATLCQKFLFSGYWKNHSKPWLDCFFAKTCHWLPMTSFRWPLFLGLQGPWPRQPPKLFLLHWPPFNLPLLQPPCSFPADLLGHCRIFPSRGTGGNPT